MYRMLSLIVFLSFATLSEAKVTFKHSTIYDEIDLNSAQEIQLESCTVGGCSLFVSAPQWNLEHTRNIFTSCKTGINESLYSYAAQSQTSGAKSALQLSSTDCSIKNYNTENVGPIVIYVVSSVAPAYQEESEVFDASNINSRIASNKLTMIMSAEPYNLFVQDSGNTLKAFVRATGFDNNNERNSDDNCRIIFENNVGQSFRLRINSPVVTINFESNSNSQICAKIDSQNVAALEYPGVATSQGYIGCTGNQFYRYSKSYSTPVFELKDSQDTERNTELTYIANTNGDDKVSFTAYSNGGTDAFEAWGNMQTTLSRTEKAFKINIAMVNNYGSSYWVGYTPKDAVSVPTGEGICGATPPTIGTVPTQPTTTSGSNVHFTAFVASAVVFYAARNL